MDLNRELEGKQLRRFEPTEFRSLEEDRALEFSFSSELPVKRWFGDEVLSHDAAAVDLQRLNDGAPVLWQHDPDRVIGVVERAWVDGERKRGMVRVKFSQNSNAQEIVRDISDGILRNVSTGYVISEAENRGEQVVATQWMPYEVSLVSVPADQTVGIGRAFEPGAPATAEPSHVNSQMEDTTPNLAEVRAQAAAEERTRVAEITKICRQHEIDPTDLIERGATEADAMKQVLTVIAERGTKQPAQPRVAPVAPQPVGSADIGLSQKEVRQFSVMKVIRALAFPSERSFREAAAFEFEASRAVAGHMNLPSAQGCYLPNEILNRDLTAASATAAGDLIATDYRAGSLIGVLRNRLALQAAGVTVWTDLMGPVAIPRETNDVTAYWVGEKTAATESSPTVDQVNMTPKVLRAYTEFSKYLLEQTSVDIENWVIRKLGIAMQLKLDKAGLYGLGNTYQPEGIKYVTGINTEDFGAAQPTYAELVSMESKINADNADLGVFTYITNSTIYGGFKTTEKFSTTGQTVLEPGGTVNNHRVIVSNQVESGDVFLGVWSQSYLALWGAVDIQVNPYSLDTTGQLRVTAGQMVDYAVAHPESFCRGNNTL